jgi:hypothetical protein
MGKAKRIQWKVTISNEHGSQAIDLLVYLPANASSDQPVPLFLGLNFAGNHCVANDPAIRLPTTWMRADKDTVMENRATDKGRGIQDRRWPVDEIVAGGFGLATAYYGDIAPDDPKHYMEGLPRLNPKLKKNLGPFALDDVYQETEQPHDGWSYCRLGRGAFRDYWMCYKKTRVLMRIRSLLWATRGLERQPCGQGATDTRFAITISNNSGCGGAAISRRAFGETVQRINSAFPHWFCDQYRKYNKAEDQSPVDQHSLLALIAPRPLYITSAQRRSLG